MQITVVGDFADPLSFLASQRVERIRALGSFGVEWLAVEADRTRPMTGGTLPEAGLERVRRLALPEEAVPTRQPRTSNSGAATAAYAESFADGAPEAMRVALFQAWWMAGLNLADPDVIRSIVFRVLNPGPAGRRVDARIHANEAIVPLGGLAPLAATRRLGFVVSTGRGPLTLAGSRRVETMRRRWHEHGEPDLPLLATDVGDLCSGERALRWLADRMPHRALEGEPGAKAMLGVSDGT